MFISPEELEKVNKLDEVIDYLSENVYNDLNYFDSEDDVCDFIADIIWYIPNRKTIKDAYYDYMINTYDLDKEEIEEPKELINYIFNLYNIKSKCIMELLNKEKLLNKFNYEPKHKDRILKKYVNESSEKESSEKHTIMNQRNYLDIYEMDFDEWCDKINEKLLKYNTDLKTLIKKDVFIETDLKRFFESSRDPEYVVDRLVDWYIKTNESIKTKKFLKENKNLLAEELYELWDELENLGFRCYNRGNRYLVVSSNDIEDWNKESDNLYKIIDLMNKYSNKFSYLIYEIDKHDAMLLLIHRVEKLNNVNPRKLLYSESYKVKKDAFIVELNNRAMKTILQKLTKFEDFGYINIEVNNQNKPTEFIIRSDYLQKLKKCFHYIDKFIEDFDWNAKAYWLYEYEKLPDNPPYIFKIVF